MKNLLAFSCFLFLLFSCIGEDIVEDFVEPELRILNPIDALVVNNTHQFETLFLNAIGQQESANTSFTSSNENVISVNPTTGLLTATGAGEATIIASVTSNGTEYSITTTITVAEETIIADEEDDMDVATDTGKNGIIQTTSSYALTGTFSVEDDSNNDILRITFEDDYNASTALPGLYVYLTNNPNSINDGLEIGAVQVFNGSHSYEIPKSDNNLTLNSFNYLLYWCKPFAVKVGGGTIE